MKPFFTTRKKTLLFFLVLIVSLESNSTETPAILREWAAYSGISDSTFKTPVLTENDFTYVATVEENTVSGADIVVIKYNNNGIASWKQPWTGSGLGRDQAADMVMDSLYLYICGTTFSSATNFDYVVIKMQKANGAIEWTQTFNGTANNYDIATAIAINDSSIYVTGVTSSLNSLLDYHTLKYNINGTLLWSVNFDYNNLLDIPFAISYSQEDSNIIVTGGSQSSIYDWDYQTNIYKYNGTTVDLGRVSGTSVGFDRATAVKTDSLGNIYITGATRENNSNFDIKTVKLDKLGNLIWQRTFDNNGGNDIANDLVVNNVGEIYLVGTIEGNGSDYLVMRLDASNGGIVWQNTIDCGANDTARAICFDSHGNIVITGQAFNPENANYDFLTVNFDRAGQELWRDYFDGPDHGDDNATNIASDKDGNIFVTGQTWVGNDYHSVTIKYKTDFFTQPPAVDTPSVAYLFYPNSGQLVNTNDSLVTDSVHYYTLHHSPQLYFGYGMMNMVWSHVDEDTATADTLQRVDVTFANSQNPTEAYPIDEDTSSYLNYFLGHCPNGITNVHGSASLLFTDVYPDIDVFYSSNNAGLKLLFIINPGASIPQEMGLAFAGDNGISVLNNWGLNVHTSLGDYEFEKPHVYQIDTGGNRVALPWHLNWNVLSSGEVNFTGWGSYDSSEPLIIEMSRFNQSILYPQIKNIQWSTHYGGNAGEFPGQITRDNNNNIYTIGHSKSTNFPSANGLFIGPNTTFGSSDILISKFSTYPGSGNNKNLIWITFYGGHGAEEGTGITVNNNTHDIYFVGLTVSTDNSLPTSNINGSPFIHSTHQGGAFDAFFARLNNNGNVLKYSTYVGGSLQEKAFTVVINQSDNSVYMGGHTLSEPNSSIPFPLVTSLHSNAYNQNVFGGNLTGSTFSGPCDGFIMKFNDIDELTWSTYFGGSAEESIEGFTITDNDNLIVIGKTNSSSTNSATASPYCLANNNHQFQLCEQGGNAYFDNSLNNASVHNNFDLFLAAFNPSDQLIWSTYFGGGGTDFLGFNGALSTTYNPSGKYALIGSTNSLTNSFPVLTPTGSFQQGNSTNNSTNTDVFIAVFTNEFEEEWCSYYGGDGLESGNGLTFDSNDNLYITGSTTSGDGTLTCTNPPSFSFPLCDANTSFYFNTDLNYGFSNISSDAFLAQFNHNYELNWSTYIGGTRNETGNSLIVNESIDGNLLFFLSWTESPKSESGFSSAANFPLQTATGYYFQSTQLFGNNDNQISMFDLGQVVGMDEIPFMGNDFILFPNPSNSFIEILINSLTDGKENIIPFSVYDVLGRIVFKSNLIKNSSNQYKSKLNVESLSSGVYFIRTEFKQNIFASKFIKN